MKSRKLKRQSPKRPNLNEVPLPASWNDIGLAITMRRNQWDATLATAYNRGHLLIEIVNEMPVKAYQKEGA